MSKTTLLWLWVIFNIFPSWGNCVNSSTNLNKCLLYLIRGIFTEDQTINFIFAHNKDVSIAIEINNPRLLINIDQPIKMSLNYHQAHVLYTHGSTTLNGTITKLTQSSIWSTSESPRAKFLLISSTSQDVSKIFDILWNFDIINAMVLLNEGNSETIVYTSNPFAEGNNCGTSANFVFAQKWDDIPKLYFNETLKALNGCPLMLLGEIVKDFKAVPSLGILWYIMELISKILNTNLFSSVVEDEYAVHYNRSNGIMLSHTLTRTESLLSLYDLTDIFYRDKLMWVVPKPDRVIGLVFYILASSVWITIATTFVLTLFLWWLISRYTSERHGFKSFWRCFIGIFSLLLSSADNLLPKTNAIRFIALFYAIYCMLMTCCFQANFSSILTRTIYQQGINTVEELADSGLPVVLAGNGKQLKYRPTYDEELADKLIAKTIYVPVVNHSNSLLKIVTYRNMSALIAKNGIKVCLPRGSVVDVIDSRLLTMEVTLTMRKGHFFLRTFNQLLGMIYEYGFYEKVFRDAMGESNPSDDTSHSALGIEHLSGSFVFCGIGLIFATGIFITEALVAKISHMFQVNNQSMRNI